MSQLTIGIPPKAIAFDFDGLLVDGLNECVLVSWNGFHSKGLDAFGPAGLAAIPVQFIDTFKNHRNFSRHLGHFITPFYLEQHFSSQAEFDAAFAALDTAAVDGFVARVTAYRHAAREAAYPLWLQYHSFYPGVEQLLEELSCPIYIVTGKDAASVDELLRCAGVQLPAARIFGECQDKVAVLQQIAARAGIRPQELYFFDDNVSNARAAHQHGFAAYWATWGYNAPDHWAIAAAAALPALSLNSFIGMGLGAEVTA